jgi:cellulose synthase/poly-beta-1,6-N-acetylglucosamine synthase-like glycosyltransferase
MLGKTFKPKKFINPSVSLLISAYNEEKVIEDKILNSLSLNYPKELLEIVILSDGSEDNTDDIVSHYKKDGVLLRRYEGRIGKTACLNDAVSMCKSEIVIFSDANSRYDKDAVLHLVKHFVDSKIGLVTGHTIYNSKNSKEVSKSIKFYSKIEKITKKYESAISSCVGADGAIFAIRRKLYRKLNDSDINDLILPLHVVRQGYRSILEEKAFCIEEISKTISDEGRRQSRITNRTLRALFNNFDLFNPLKYGIFSFELFAHKLLKFIIPHLLIVLFLINIFLTKIGWAYAIIFAMQIAFYSLAIMGLYSSKKNKKASFVAIPMTFTMSNYAILYGWLTFFKGQTYTTWNISR